MSLGPPWAIRLPGASRTLRFEVADPERHTVLLHDWLHRPHVSPWWGPERTLPETREYIERQRATAHLTPWIVDAGDLPFGYVETYRAAEDPLAEAFPLHPSDRGWHVLVGPEEVLGQGLPRLMGRAVLAHLLTEPAGWTEAAGAPASRAADGSARRRADDGTAAGAAAPIGSDPAARARSGAGDDRAVPPVDRVVCEPDERNGRMIAFCQALGYERLASLDLGYKQAALLACTRDRFEALWPGDLAAGEASWPDRPDRAGGEPGVGAVAGGWTDTRPGGMTPGGARPDLPDGARTATTRAAAVINDETGAQATERGATAS